MFRTTTSQIHQIHTPSEPVSISVDMSASVFGYYSDTRTPHIPFASLYQHSLQEPQHLSSKPLLDVGALPPSSVYGHWTGCNLQSLAYTLSGSFSLSKSIHVILQSPPCSSNRGNFHHSSHSCTPCSPLRIHTVLPDMFAVHRLLA